MLSMEPSHSRLWIRGIIRGLRSVARERQWFAAFGAFFGVMFILQVLLFGLLGMQTIQDTLAAHTDIRLELRSQATDKERQGLYAQLQQLPYISESVYITKEQAYEHARSEDPQLIAFLEKFGMENPFPDTIGVSLTSFEAYQQFTEFINLEKWRNILSPTSVSRVSDEGATTRGIARITLVGQSFAIGILLVVGVVLIFTTIELVRRRSLDRSEEVFVEQLVGAHPLSIVVPFATEASVLLWAAIIASFFLLAAALMMFLVLFPSLSTSGIMGTLGPQLSRHALSALPLFLALEMLLAPMIALLGAWLGMRPIVQSRVLAVSRT